METLKRIGEMTPSKKTSEEVVKNMVEGVLSGNVDPVEAEIFIAWLEGICKEYRKNADVKEILKSKLEHEFGEIEIKGSGKISLVRSATYDFFVSKMYSSLDKEEAAIKEKKKAIETALKNCSDTVPFVDYESGEMITTPPIDGEKKTVRVTLSKGA